MPVLSSTNGGSQLVSGGSAGDAEAAMGRAVRPGDEAGFIARLGGRTAAVAAVARTGVRRVDARRLRLGSIWCGRAGDTGTAVVCRRAPARGGHVPAIDRGSASLVAFPGVVPDGGAGICSGDVERTRSYGAGAEETTSPDVDRRGSMLGKLGGGRGAAEMTMGLGPTSG